MNKKTGLGRAIQKSLYSKKPKKYSDGAMIFTTTLRDDSEKKRLNLRSVTHESSLQEFMSVAELAERDFTAERLNCKVTCIKNGILSQDETLKIKKFHEENQNFLRIPRRPKWTKGITKEELISMEKSSFLDWRRNLALFQESNNVVMTPFERTLEFWRHLWRTIERSDVLVQIVDARNPLLFRCEDLENYVLEVSEHKMNVLLVNKADLLTENQRNYWSKYFASIKVNALFFSAITADDEASESEINNINNDLKSDKESESDEESENEEKLDDEVKSTTGNDLKENISKLEESVEKIAEKLEEIMSNLSVEADETENNSLYSSEILSPEKLKKVFETIHKGPKVNEGVTTIGFVGYPNVGKSSTINSLLDKKKVSTSSTAGKTKHIQTLYLNTKILLCDCPGLVMPSFVCTKADLVINGILPVDELRDHVGPVDLLAQLIPRHIIEDTYNIMIPKSSEDSNSCPTSEEVLNAYAYLRGFMTANGQPDKARAARFILKDFQKGKLLYCYAPPDMDQESYHLWPEKKRAAPSYIPPKTLRAIKVRTEAEEFENKEEQQLCHVKGRKWTKAMNKKEKGLYKNPKQPKKEKLRRTYAHLDQH